MKALLPVTAPVVGVEPPTSCRLVGGVGVEPPTNCQLAGGELVLLGGLLVGWALPGGLALQSRMLLRSSRIR